MEAEPSSAVSLVKSIINYVNTRSPSLPPGAVQKLVEHQCNACISHLRSMQLGYTDASWVATLVHGDGSPFGQSQADRIMGVVDGKLNVGNVACSSGSKTQLQTHHHLKEYLTEELWTTILSHSPMSQKLDACGKYFVQKLLLRHPSETTRRDMVSLVIAACNMEPTPDEAHGWVDTFKTVMEVNRTLTPGGAKGPLMYPSNPEEFTKAFPGSLADTDIMVASKVSESAFRIAQSKTPCRTSNKALGNVSGRVGKRLTSKCTVKSDPVNPLEELTRFVLGKTVSSNLEQLPAATALLKAASTEATPMKFESSTSVKSEEVATSADATKSEPQLPSPEASSGSLLKSEDLFGDLDKLRATVDGKFKVAPAKAITKTSIKFRLTRKRPAAGTGYPVGKPKLAKKTEPVSPVTTSGGPLTTECPGGWTMITYTRPTGKTWSHWKDADGKPYRSLKSAVAAGFVAPVS